MPSSAPDRLYKSFIWFVIYAKVVGSKEKVEYQLKVLAPPKEIHHIKHEKDSSLQSNFLCSDQI